MSRSSCLDPCEKKTVQKIHNLICPLKSVTSLARETAWSSYPAAMAFLADTQGISKKTAKIINTRNLLYDFS
jgi:hypothetical protein